MKHICPECGSELTFYTMARCIECVVCGWTGYSLRDCKFVEDSNQIQEITFHDIPFPPVGVLRPNEIGKELEYYSEIEKQWVKVLEIDMNGRAISMETLDDKGRAHISVHYMYIEDMRFRWVI